MKLRDKVQDFGALSKPVQANVFFIKCIKKRTRFGVRFRNIDFFLFIDGTQNSFHKTV